MIPAADLTLQLAIATVFLLTAFTLSFMGYAFLLHLRSLRVERRRQTLEDRWQGRLLDAATGESAPAPDRDTPRPEEPDVDEADRVLFLELVTKYARALEGPERQKIERVGRPYLDALEPLLEDPDAYRRAYALDMLGELGYEQAGERITRGLADESGLVAMVAARALARRGDPKHVPLLLSRLGAFESWSANYLSSLLVSFGPGAAPFLRGLAIDTDAKPRLRSVAFQALRELHDMASVGPAAGLLPGEDDIDVQAEIIRLIGALGGPGQLPVIRPFASSSAPHVRAVALRAISNLSDRRTSDVELVSAGLDDPSPWVALQAAHGLLALGRADELRDLAASTSPRAPLAAEVLESAP
jgi:hypothetical protein